MCDVSLPFDCVGCPVGVPRSFLIPGCSFLSLSFFQPSPLLETRTKRIRAHESLRRAIQAPGTNILLPCSKKKRNRNNSFAASPRPSPLFPFFSRQCPLVFSFDRLARIKDDASPLTAPPPFDDGQPRVPTFRERISTSIDARSRRGRSPIANLEFM